MTRSSQRRVGPESVKNRGQDVSRLGIIAAPAESETSRPSHHLQRGRYFEPCFLAYIVGLGSDTMCHKRNRIDVIVIADLLSQHKLLDVELLNQMLPTYT